MINAVPSPPTTNASNSATLAFRALRLDGDGPLPSSSSAMPPSNAAADESAMEGVIDGAKAATTEWFSHRRQRTVSLSIPTPSSATFGSNESMDAFNGSPFPSADCGGGGLFDRRGSDPVGTVGRGNTELGAIGNTRARSMTCPHNLVRLPKIWNDDPEPDLSPEDQSTLDGPRSSLADGRTILGAPFDLRP
jgi:hypothetical protein